MFRTIAAIVLLAPALLANRAAAADCYANWSLAAPVVRKEGLTTVERLWKLARSKISGDIVKTTLCAEKGGFVYRLVIRDPKGRLKSRTVDARAPFGR